MVAGRSNTPPRSSSTVRRRFRSEDIVDIIYIIYAMLQLRYLQTLNSISAENNSTIVFPVPIDIMSEIVEKKVSSIYNAYNAIL